MTLDEQHDDEEEAPPPLPPMLASKYRLTERIGEGGMGVVYLGTHAELKTKVAIKVLQPKLARDAVARARFVREARLAASLESEHTARIHDVGTDEGTPYIVMEYLAGESLDARLQRQGALPLSDVATIMLQALEALSEAHARGLVHRDLKPANLFLVARQGEPLWVKVLDFGISKVVGEAAASDSNTDVSLTAPRTLLGSPEYMSPEQLRDSAAVDARSDLWACGVLLFELLTKTMPFEGATLADLYAKIISDAPRSLSSATPQALPAPVLRLVERCLQKEPKDRPQSAFEIAEVLAPHASASSRALLPRIASWCKAQVPAVAAPSRARRVVGGVALVAASCAVAFVLATLRTPAPMAASATAPRSDVAALHPIEHAAPPTPSPSASSPAPSATPMASASAAPVKPQAKAAKARDGRIRDLDGIELIQ